MTLSPALFFVIPSPVTIVSVILFILAYLFYRCVLSYPGSDLLGGKYAQRSQSVVWRAFMEHRINKDPRTLYGLNMRCEDGWNVDLLRESSFSMLDVYPQVPVTESQRTSANGRSTHISHETNSADKPNEQFIFGCHPHGPMAVTLFMMKQYPSSMLDLLFPTIRLENIRCLAASVLFQMPVLRELCLWSACIDASRKVAKKALDMGYSLFVYPGGEKEQILSSNEKEILFLKRRRGFIRLCVEKNIPAVPVYVFGENDLYWSYNLQLPVFLQSIQQWCVQNLWLALPVFTGKRWLFSPGQPTLSIVFGKPVYPPTASDCNLTNAEEEQSTLPSSTLHNRRPGTNNKTDADPDAHAGTTISEGSAVIPEENTEEEQLREKRREDIQRRTEIMHARYIESVQRIYHRYKGEFGYADRPLEIV